MLGWRIRPVIAYNAPRFHRPGAQSIPKMATPKKATKRAGALPAPRTKGKLTAASADAPVRVARIYLRVSTDEQDLARQELVVDQAKAAGYYVAAVYREKASGARPDRPELLRMIADLQPGEVVMAERIDRISRLPLPAAEQLVDAIKAKGAKLAVPGIVDLAELTKDLTGVAAVVVQSVQDMLLRVALQIARDDYEVRQERQRQGIAQARAQGRFTGRRADTEKHKRVLALRAAGKSIAETATLASCSASQVKRICAAHKHAAKQLAPTRPHAVR